MFCLYFVYIDLENFSSSVVLSKIVSNDYILVKLSNETIYVGVSK